MNPLYHFKCSVCGKEAECFAKFNPDGQMTRICADCLKKIYFTHEQKEQRDG